MNVSFKGILIFSIILSLTSCDKLPYEHFSDSIIRVQETEKYGLATGIKAFYVYYGVMRLPGNKVVAGTAVGFNKQFHFPILELLKKYPQLQNEKSLKAAAAQQELWRHHPPEVNIRRPD